MYRIKSKINKLSRKQILKICSKSSSIRNALFNIGYKNIGTYLYKEFRERLNDLNIYDVSFTKNDERKISDKTLGLKNKLKLSELLVENSINKDNTGLKKKILNEGLLEYKCSSCSNTGIWMNKLLVLQLEHINGINNDNRIENLTLLCPNCHSQTPTFCRGNLSLLKSNKVKDDVFCKCGTKIPESYTVCISCETINRMNSAYSLRKVVDRPSLNELIMNVNDLGYKGTGKKYGVSDNCIKKWIRIYKKIDITMPPI